MREAAGIMHSCRKQESLAVFLNPMITAAMMVVMISSLPGTAEAASGLLCVFACLFLCCIFFFWLQDGMEEGVKMRVLHYLRWDAFPAY
jgi:hypothetical protein